MRCAHLRMRISLPVRMVLPTHLAHCYLGEDTRRSCARATILAWSPSSHGPLREARSAVRTPSTRAYRTRATSVSTATQVCAISLVVTLLSTSSIAVAMCETFVSSDPPADASTPRPFVYISAEDVFRPFIPSGYIESKRQAEQIISSMVSKRSDFRPVFIRPSTYPCLCSGSLLIVPGLVYHAHLRPFTSLPAALLDLSTSLHHNAPRVVPTPAGALRMLASATGGLSSPFTAMSNALTTPPIHVDHVADAVVRALDVRATNVRGVVDVRDMRELIGWSAKPEANTSASS
jgi:hypothetical protein